MVFDPNGQAGDTVAKDLTVDVREGLSFVGRVWEAPHDGGYDVLVLRFSNFDRGDRFEFSVDVDPTSITGVGAPGPAESGSVGGLELVGATITATFDSGLTVVNQVYRMPNAGAGSGALAVMRPGAPLRPHIVWFGEEVPALEQALEQVAEADVVLVVGTSLKVYPAAGLIAYAPPHAAGYLIDPKIGRASSRDRA